VGEGAQHKKKCQGGAPESCDLDWRKGGIRTRKRALTTLSGGKLSRERKVAEGKADNCLSKSSFPGKKKRGPEKKPEARPMMRAIGGSHTKKGGVATWRTRGAALTIKKWTLMEGKENPPTRGIRALFSFSCRNFREERGLELFSELEERDRDTVAFSQPGRTTDKLHRAQNSVLGGPREEPLLLGR